MADPDDIRIGAEQQKRLLDYLTEEHNRALREVYEPLQSRFNGYEDLYNGVVEPRRAKWMSNIPSLLGATFTDAVTARILNTMNAYKPTYTVEAIRTSEWVPIAKGVEDFTEYQVKHTMRFYQVMRRAVFEQCRLGTAAILAPWVEKYDYVRSRKMLFFKGMRKVFVKQGVELMGIPIRDLILPGGYSEVEDLPWWSRKIRYTPLALQIVADEFPDTNIAKILGLAEVADESQADAQTRAGESTPSGPLINCLETWVKFNLESKTVYTRYIITWHPSSNQIMRIRRDTYPRWPLFLLRYGPRDYGIYGLGVMELSKPYDGALYGLVNLLIDNFKIATMMMIAAKKGAGLRPDMDIYPGKFWLLDDPKNDISGVSLGAAYNLNPAFTRLVTDLSERRTGMSDYNLGRETPVSGGRGTATGTLALIQEGQRRFDLTIRDSREELDALGNYNLRMNHEQLPWRVPYLVVGQKAGAQVQRFLEMPTAPPFYSINLVSNLSNVAMNKEVAKQDAIQTMGLMQQFYQQMLNLNMMMAQQPQLAPLYQQIMKAGAEKFRNVLTVFGEPSPERYTDFFITGAGMIPEEATPPEAAPAVGPEGETSGLAAPNLGPVQ